LEFVPSSINKFEEKWLNLKQALNRKKNKADEK
jgi:hypothetical protein